VSSRFLPNINWVRAILCPAVVFIATGMDRGYQTDFWHHLACGREIAQTGQISTVETLTFTVAGQPVRDANWLTQITYFRLYELGGLALVQTINSLILAAAAGLLVWICRRRGASPGVAAALGVLAFAGIWQTLLIRPQSVSLLLFVVLYAILIEAEQRRWLLALAPIVMALWVNVHGGFLIGVVLVGAFFGATLAEKLSAPLRRRFFVGPLRDEEGPRRPAAAESSEARIDGSYGSVPLQEFARAFGIGQPAKDTALSIRSGGGMVKALAVCMVGCVLATLLNPYGTGVYEYVFKLSTVASGRQVEEWMPPSMGLWVGRAWAGSILALIALLAVTSRRPRARDLFIALCFIPLACTSVRMVPWWLLTLTPVIAMTLARNLPAKRIAASFSPRGSFVAGAMLLLVCGSAVMSAPLLERFNPVLGNIRCAARLESDLQAVVNQLKPGNESRVFTRLEWGEYLDWAGHPRCKPFMDGRIEIYPDDVWQEYHAITSARADWQSILDKRRVDVLLLDSTFHVELLPKIEANTQWELLDQKGSALLYGRRDALTDGH
jgi:hypothetical protein